MTSFPALGTTATVLSADPGNEAAAVESTRAVIDRVDLACSRFREDGELHALNQSAGRPFACSPTLLAAVRVALRAAAATGGLVVPTVGGALRRLGYDRTFAEVPPAGQPLRIDATVVPSWQLVSVDEAAGTVTVPKGASLDLGATAKAWCADQAAAAAAARTGSGVLVSLGGDIACSGAAPPEGWAVRVTDDHAAPAGAGGQTVALFGGGLATSGVTVRRWRRGDTELHHLIDPRTGRPAAVVWRTVSVTAATCVDANTASTAAVVLGAGATAWLAALGLPARLVSRDGHVTTLNGWPIDTREV